MAVRFLWRDPEGQISLVVISLFWAAASVLQFVILRWAEQVLRLSLAQAPIVATVVGF